MSIACAHDLASPSPSFSSLDRSFHVPWWPLLSLVVVIQFLDMCIFFQNNDPRLNKAHIGIKFGTPIPTILNCSLYL